MFLTPYSRIVRRRAFPRMYTQAVLNEVESEVSFPIDVMAEEDAYVVTALLPGAAAEDVNIQIDNETLTIQGEIKDHRQEGENYLLRERPTGRFVRMLTLPAPLDSNQAEASFSDGVLTLRIPKAESARPRTIKVKYN